MQSNAVASLNNQNVYNQIQNWLNNKGKKSAQTKRNYEGHIRQFFAYTRNLPKGSEIESLSPAMLEYTHHDIVAYQNYLTDLYKREDGEIVGGTVNTKMAAVKSLFKYLSIDNSNINMNIFNAVDRMKDNPESYGYLTWEETEQMINLALSLENGLEKSVLIETAARTGIRVDALLRVEKSDLKYENGYWYVYALDKGKKKDRKPIPEHLYERIVELLEESIDDKVFHMSVSTAERTVKDLSKEMGIEEDRNIAFHSLKKVGIMYELMTTGNIHIAAKHGNHADPRITMKAYANKFDKPSAMPGVRMGIEMNEEILDNLSREQLLQLIKTSTPSTKIEMITRANQIYANSV